MYPAEFIKHQLTRSLHVKFEQRSCETSAATRYSCHVCLLVTTAVMNLSNSGEGKGVPALN